MTALACALCLFAAQTAAAQTITVQTDRPGASISPTLFGLFFEDINFGADGGLYPERVKNRSFEFPGPLMGWKQLNPGDSKGALQVYDTTFDREKPNSHYLRIRVDAPGKGFGPSNEGFRGVGVERGKEYTFSVSARRVGAAPSALRVEVEGADGKTLGQAKVTGFTPEWKKFMEDGAFNQTFMTGPDYLKWVEKNEALHRNLMKEAGFLAKP